MRPGEAVECDDKFVPIRQEGRKDDQEKIMTHLYPVDALLETCQVLTYGAKKYEPRNWEKGFEWSRAYGAALRHLFAFWQGEDLDPETGISHLAHAACEVAFLQSFHIREIGKDDRPVSDTKDAKLVFDNCTIGGK